MMSHNRAEASSAAAIHSNHPDDAAAAGSRRRSFLTDPWSQGVLTGVLTLIPARSYPIWLRRLRVPFPRAVMGAAAGTSAWWSAVKENERERPAAYASQ